MLNRQFGLAIAATVLVASSLTGVQNSLCRAISSNSRVMYLFAEYEMLTGDKESAVKLLQQASVQKENAPVVKHNSTCSEMGGAMVATY